MQKEKVCANCGNSVTYALSRQVYCMDVPWWRVIVFRPRAVQPNDTCRKWCTKMQQKTR